MKTILIAATLLMISPAVAQTIPDEAMKARALQRAYELNGNRMCCGSIDVSQDPYVTGRSEAPDLNMDDIRKFLQRQNEKRELWQELLHKQ